jgi:glycosyltransferase involved in cell wall biosynthesis
MHDGLSVIIWRHKGASRLSAALRHLKGQRAVSPQWEVLLVDNASSDGSSQLAISSWQKGPAALRVVSEPRLGLSYARERGLAESRYGFIDFVDDDNWVGADWVSNAYDVLSADSGLGPVGSICDPVYEVPPPEWFQNFHRSFAILTDGDLQQMPQPPEFLNGAGPCIRRIASEKLAENGFRSQRTDRVGTGLSAGGDSELTLALGLAGWKLRVERRLRSQHFMPSQRVQWKYLRKLLRNYSASQVLLDAYSKHSLSLGPGFRRWLSEPLVVPIRRVPDDNEQATEGGDGCALV